MPSVQLHPPAASASLPLPLSLSLSLSVATNCTRCSIRLTSFPRGWAGREREIERERERGGAIGAERRFPGTRRLYSLPGWIQRPGLELIGPASSWLEMLSARLRSHRRSPSVSWLRVCVLPPLHPLPSVPNAYAPSSNCRFFSLSLYLSISICLSVYIRSVFVSLSFVWNVDIRSSRSSLLGLCRIMSYFIVGFCVGKIALCAPMGLRDCSKVFEVKVACFNWWSGGGGT